MSGSVEVLRINMIFPAYSGNTQDLEDKYGISGLQWEKKVREKSRECYNHKPQPFPDPKRKRKPTNLNKHKPNKRTKSTKISSLFPKRGNRNTKTGWKTQEQNDTRKDIQQIAS